MSFILPSSSSSLVQHPSINAPTQQIGRTASSLHIDVEQVQHLPHCPVPSESELSKRTNSHDRVPSSSTSYLGKVFLSKLPLHIYLSFLLFIPLIYKARVRAYENNQGIRLSQTDLALPQLILTEWRTLMGISAFLVS